MEFSFAKIKQRLRKCAFPILTSMVLAGCAPGAVDLNYFAAGAKEELINRSPRESKSGINRSSLELCDLQASQDTLLGIIKITGNAGAKYEEYAWDEWIETWKHIWYGAYGIKSRESVYTKKVKDNERVLSKEFVPSKLEICVGGAADTKEIINVAENGFFDAQIGHRLFKKPAVRKYQRIMYREREITISTLKDDLKNIPGLKSNPIKLDLAAKEYFYEIDKEAVLEFVSSKFFPIEIRMQDKNTREPVQAKIVVKLVSMPDIELIVRTEIGDSTYNRLLEEIGEGSIIPFFDPISYRLPTKKEEIKLAHLPKLKKIVGIENAFYEPVICLGAIDNCIYDIRTYNPNYYHEKISFVAKRSNQIKAILLTETGEKVRVDLSKEGRGVLVDE